MLDPAQSSVPDPVRRLLARVAERYALVACISGRRALEARRVVGLDSITYVGNHGLESLAPGAQQPSVAPELAARRSVVGDFARSAYVPALEALGVRLEDKDAIWAFHWRGAPDAHAAREALDDVSARADREGLVPHWGRMVLEIRPPVAADKGTAVASALDGKPLAHALYAGDDTTDLDAFRKLRDLEGAGRLEALCIGVRSAEGPKAIEREADLIVDGPEGITRMLEALAD